MLIKIDVGTRFTLNSEDYIVTGANRYKVTNHDISNQVELEVQDNKGITHLLQFGDSTYSVGNNSLIALATLIRS